MCVSTFCILRQMCYLPMTVLKMTFTLIKEMTLFKIIFGEIPENFICYTIDPHKTIPIEIMHDYRNMDLCKQGLIIMIRNCRINVPYIVTP